MVPAMSRAPVAVAVGSCMRSVVVAVVLAGCGRTPVWISPNEDVGGDETSASDGPGWTSTSAAGSSSTGEPYECDPVTGLCPLELVLRHVEGAREPLGSPAEHYVLLELASADDDEALREKLTRVLATGLEAGEIVDGTLAESEAQRRALWLLRERVPEAERREGGSVKHDISVRIGRIPEFLERAEPALRGIGPHRLSIYGHIGDGNLHCNVLPPVGRSSEAFRAEKGAAFSACVHDVCAALDGSFSAEHGVGILKVDELARYESPTALALMRTLKAALDPHGIMNPGKVL